MCLIEDANKLQPKSQSFINPKEYTKILPSLEQDTSSKRVQLLNIFLHSILSLHPNIGLFGVCPAYIQWSTGQSASENRKSAGPGPKIPFCSLILPSPWGAGTGADNGGGGSARTFWPSSLQPGSCHSLMTIRIQKQTKQKAYEMTVGHINFIEEKKTCICQHLKQMIQIYNHSNRQAPNIISNIIFLLKGFLIYDPTGKFTYEVRKRKINEAIFDFSIT